MLGAEADGPLGGFLELHRKQTHGKCVGSPLEWQDTKSLNKWFYPRGTGPPMVRRHQASPPAPSRKNRLSPRPPGEAAVRHEAELHLALGGGQHVAARQELRLDDAF